MIFHTLPLTIKSVNNLPDKGEKGVIYYLTQRQKQYIYTNKWEEIGSTTWNDVNTQKMLPTNCKNCGAALHGHKCEYCGTTYN